MSKSSKASSQPAPATVVVEPSSSQRSDRETARPRTGDQDRAARVKAAKGKFAHVRITSEQFNREKQEEIDWEDRR